MNFEIRENNTAEELVNIAIWSGTWLKYRNMTNFKEILLWQSTRYDILVNYFEAKCNFLKSKWTFHKGASRMMLKNPCKAFSKVGHWVAELKTQKHSSPESAEHEQRMG